MTNKRSRDPLKLIISKLVPFRHQCAIPSHISSTPSGYVPFRHIETLSLVGRAHILYLSPSPTGYLHSQSVTSNPKPYLWPEPAGGRPSDTCHSLSGQVCCLHKSQPPAPEADQPLNEGPETPIFGALNGVRMSHVYFKKNPMIPHVTCHL